MRAAFGLLALFLLAGCGAPSDEEMIAHFGQLGAHFTELRDLAQEDQRFGLQRVDREYLDADWENNPPEFPASDLSSMLPSRRQVYAALMDKLEIEIVEMWPDGVSFVHWRTGFVFAGSSKSYFWQVTPPDPVVERLDKPLLPEGFVTDTWFSAYRPIEGQWYLHYSAN